MSAIRVVIADDRAIVREGLRLLLERDAGFAVVGEASTGAEALASVAAAEPDVLLLGVRTPDGDGRDVLAALAGERGRTRVLVLAGEAQADAGEELLRLGARGVAPKSASLGEVAQAIRAVHAGEIWADRPTLSRFIDRLKGDAGAPADPRPLLSARECQVLEAVGGGQNNPQIARRLSISENTVKAHLSRIFRKLQVTDRTQAVVAGLERGYIRLSPTTNDE